MNDGGWAVLAVLVLAMGFGVWAGSTWTNNSWERMLVDNPDGVAAIRSRVLAERAEREAAK